MFEEQQREQSVVRQQQARINAANRAPLFIAAIAVLAGLALLASGKGGAMAIGLALLVGGPLLFAFMRRG